MYMDRGKRSELAEVLAICLLGLLLRLFAGRNSLQENGILLAGYDEYYHMRRILYTVGHFPNTLWFDSYLDYPHGLNITWPPLYDQLSAGVSLALGQHSQPGVEMVSALLPIILGVAAVAVVYYMVREIFDDRIALLAGFMTAIAPYHILKTMLGVVDHHSLEVLLLLISLLFLIMALSRPAQRYLLAAGAGMTMAALAYTWLGADAYLGIFLVYAAIQMTLDLKRGTSSRDMVTTLLAAFGVTLVLILPFGNDPWLQPSFLGVATIIAAILLLYAISLLMVKRSVHWAAFPISILVLISAFVLLSPLMGGLFNVDRLIRAGGEYIFGGNMSGRIAEAEPLFEDTASLSNVIFSFLGLNILLSIAGMIAFVLFMRSGYAGKSEGQTLLLVWAAASMILTFGQARFLYISTIAMGILISVLFFWVLNRVEKSTLKQKLKPPWVLAAALLLLLVLPTLAETVSYAAVLQPPIAGDWNESLHWLEKNSNPTSFYGDPSEVPEYSVMSWWDYGNWVVYVAKRPVVANNFQAGLLDSAKFYLSQSEDDATAILDARRSRYVLIDYDMLYGKLPAIVNWADEDLNDYYRMEEYESGITPIAQPKLLNTTLARLYLFDGAGLGRFRLIYESHKSLSGNVAASGVKILEYVPGALIRVKTGSNQRVGALLNMTSNQGRSFTYINEAMLRGDSYEIRVPYSTESRYDTHALGPYLIFSGNETGMQKTQDIDVSEQDVIEGKIVEVDLR